MLFFSSAYNDHIDKFLKSKMICKINPVLMTHRGFKPERIDQLTKSA